MSKPKLIKQFCVAIKIQKREDSCNSSSKMDGGIGGTVFVVDEEVGARVNIGMNMRGVFLDAVRRFRRTDDMMRLNKWVEKITPMSPCTKGCATDDTQLDGYNVVLPYNFIESETESKEYGEKIVTRAIFVALSRWRTLGAAKRKFLANAGDADNPTKLRSADYPLKSLHQFLFERPVMFEQLVRMDVSQVAELLFALRGLMARNNNRQPETYIDYIEEYYAERMSASDIDEQWLLTHPTYANMLKRPVALYARIIHMLLCMSASLDFTEIAPGMFISKDINLGVVIPARHPIAACRTLMPPKKPPHTIVPSNVTMEKADSSSCKVVIPCNHTIVRRHIVNILTSRSPAVQDILRSDYARYGILEILATDPEFLLIPVNGSYAYMNMPTATEKAITAAVEKTWDYADTDKTTIKSITKYTQEVFARFQQDLDQMSFVDLRYWIYIHVLYCFSIGQSPYYDKHCDMSSPHSYSVMARVEMTRQLLKYINGLESIIKLDLVRRNEELFSSYPHKNAQRQKKPISKFSCSSLLSAPPSTSLSSPPPPPSPPPPMTYAQVAISPCVDTMMDEELPPPPLILIPVPMVEKTKDTDIPPLELVASNRPRDDFSRVIGRPGMKKMETAKREDEEMDIEKELAYWRGKMEQLAKMEGVLKTYAEVSNPFHMADWFCLIRQ